MDSARDKRTGEIVEAEALWGLDDVDKHGYVCRGCDIQVFPAAYVPPKKVRPYFTPRETPHEPDCEENLVGKVLERAKRGPVCSPDGTGPISFPDRLELVQDDGGVRDREKRASGGAREHAPPAYAKRRRGSRWAAGTIRPICNRFILFRFDRHHMPLRIPGIDGHTYGAVFWSLPWKEVRRLHRPKLFYAELRWTKPPEKRDQGLVVTLSAGDRADGKLVRPYRVIIRWEEWTPSDRRVLESEIAAVIEEASSAGRHREERTEAKKGWVFFVGDQLPGDDSLFEVRDRRLVCALSAHTVYAPIE